MQLVVWFTEKEQKSEKVWEHRPYASLYLNA